MCASKCLSTRLWVVSSEERSVTRYVFHHRDGRRDGRPAHLGSIRSRTCPKNLGVRATARRKKNQRTPTKTAVLYPVFRAHTSASSVISTESVALRFTPPPSRCITSRSRWPRVSQSRAERWQTLGGVPRRGCFGDPPGGWSKEEKEILMKEANKWMLE